MNKQEPWAPALYTKELGRSLPHLWIQQSSEPAPTPLKVRGKNLESAYLGRHPQTREIE